MIAAGLRDALRHAAASERLLVASDFDGTLAELASRPDLVAVNHEARAALVALVGLAGTTVAVVSGRTRAELAVFLGEVDGMQLIGAHGAEREGLALSVASNAPAVRDVQSRVAALVTGLEGFLLEAKPTGITLHTRLVADRDLVEQVLDAVRAGPAALPGIRAIAGKEMVELTVATATKGTTLAELRDDHTHTVFVGDDVTDEDAFAVLGSDDVGIKVGEGPSLAAYRVGKVAEVAAVLSTLASLRRGHVAAGR